MHYQALKLDKMYKYALFYLQGMVYRHAQSISLARTTEKLSNIKSNYTQNRLKCGLRNMEKKVRNVRGHLTYKEVPEKD